MTTQTENSIVIKIDALIHLAKHQGLDPEMILARVYASHLMSDEKCDSCHIYGITFAEKLNKLMSET